MTKAAFQATFTDWRLIKGRKVVQLVFEVPLEGSDEAYRVLGGMPDPGRSVWCAVARLQQGEQTEVANDGNRHLSELVVANGDDRHSNTLPITESPGRGSPQGTPARAPKPNRLTQQAGICCGDPRFRAFLASYGMGGDNSPEQAAVAVRLICGVSSRREIVVGSPAAAKWDELYSKFIAWRDVAR